MVARKFILVRRLPDGEIKAHTTPFAQVRFAARAAGMCLYDNGIEQKTVAQTFSARLIEQPLGTIWGHSSGYDFRILEADFTSDGVAITPGLRVQENSLRWGTVDAAQFMDEGALMPGGQHFDHWYFVQRDDEDRCWERFDRWRMTATGLIF